ncbi:hypothetical protein CPB86DRAFT_820804 [Serendipita vermifera]|nr:hypothetical protein CPB86DRAFT_820804 [Serendipita vermifera]
MLLDTLDRCGNLLLDISIGCYTAYPDMVREIGDCIDLISTPTVMKRVVSLSIYLRSPYFATLDYFKYLSLQSIRHLKILGLPSSRSKNNLLASISKTATQLQSLSTISTLNASAFPDHIWHGIKSLHLQPDFPPSNIDEWVHKVSHLEEFSGLPTGWPSETTPNYTFPNLLNIALACTPRTLHRLHLPALQDLQIKDWSRRVPSPGPMALAPRWQPTHHLPRWW